MSTVKEDPIAEILKNKLSINIITKKFLNFIIRLILPTLQHL